MKIIVCKTFFCFLRLDQQLQLLKTVTFRLEFTFLKIILTQKFPVVRYFRWKLELFSNILKLIVEDFRTLIICFHNVNGIIKRRLARLKAWILGLIVDHWMFLIAFHYFKNSWYMWKDDNTMNPKKIRLILTLFALITPWICYYTIP